jgi:hypothetical protein
MKKPYKFSVLSNQKCRNCSKPLKQNLIEKCINPTLCYVCYQFIVKKLMYRVKIKRGTITKKTISYKDEIQLNRKKYGW